MAARILGVCVLGVLIYGSSAAGQQPSTADQQPSTGQQQSTAAQPPPVSPTPPPVIRQSADFYGNDGFSITLQYWLGTGYPTMRTGRANTNGEPSSIDYQGKPNPAPGATVSIPVGKHNAIRASYFRVQGSGNPTASQPLILFGTSYNQGDYLAMHYTMQNFKLSLDYLSWPFPVKDSKFHVKTLWEVQYVTTATGVDAPLRHGQTDAAGNLINTSAYGKNWLFYPSFGLGIDYLATHNFRFEARASGFAFPHRSTLWDTEASLNYRFGKFEIQGGAKVFHFKTSPKGVEYVASTFPGVFVGLRWYPDFSRH